MIDALEELIVLIISVVVIGDAPTLNVISVPFTDKDFVALNVGSAMLPTNCTSCTVAVSCASLVLSNINVPPVASESVVTVLDTASILCVALYETVIVSPLIVNWSPLSAVTPLDPVAEVPSNVISVLVFAMAPFVS